MAKEYASEDQRIMALEQTIPGIQRALDDLSDRMNSLHYGVGSTVGSNFMQSRGLPPDVLLEQLFAVLRTVYWQPTPMFKVPLRDAQNPARITTTRVGEGCYEIVFEDDRISGLHEFVLEPTGIGPGNTNPDAAENCLELVEPLVVDGRAVVQVCCQRDAQGKVKDCYARTRLSLRDSANNIVVATLIGKGCGKRTKS
jgi:hypothetical protein